MDTHTLSILEFDKIRGLVAGYAACSLGREAALALEPTTDSAFIHDRQALTTEMTEALSAGLSPPFGGLRDVRGPVHRARTGATLDADELAEVGVVLEAVGNLDRWLGRIGDGFPRLGALKASVGEFGGIASSIRSCLDERANVLDTASRRLSALRREIHHAEERIQETLRRMLRSPEIRRILRYPNFTMVGHHYVLPIAREHRGEIQGSVLRTSASNETAFIEPQAIAERSAELSFIRAREQKEVRRILRWLSAQVGQAADSLLETLATLGLLDLVFAQGRYSLDFNMTPPDFNTEGRVVLRGARHPLLEALFRARNSESGSRNAKKQSAMVSSALAEAPDEGSSSLELVSTPVVTPQSEFRIPQPEHVVPIDVHLGLQANILVVTGPNTGGKTVALKTVALLAVMAQSGLHIPAHQGSRLPIFDHVLADIGDEQSLEQSLSTFSSHIRRVSEILARATEHSLVVLDELGAGTDPAEGAALGRAILDELDSIGCRAIVTTHIGDLKTYAFANSRAENAAVEFDDETLRPLYHLHIGDIGRSNALQIARRLNLPEHLITRAATYLEHSQGRELPEWEIVQKLRKEAEEARQAALAAQAEAERTREALARKLTDLQRQDESDARMTEARARLQPGDRVVVPRFGYDRPGRVVRLDPRKQIATIAIGAMKWDVPIAELVPQTVRAPEAAKPPAAHNRSRIDDFEE